MKWYGHNDEERKGFSCRAVRTKMERKTGYHMEQSVHAQVIGPRECQ